MEGRCPEDSRRDGWGEKEEAKSLPAKQVAAIGIRECLGGTLKGNYPAGRDGFCVTKEGLGNDEEKRQGGENGGRQEGEKQVNAISRGVDTRKMEEENEGKNVAGKEPGMMGNLNRDTEARRSDEEEESRGPRGAYCLGGEEEPSRKEDTTKGSRHVPGGPWLDKRLDKRENGNDDLMPKTMKLCLQ
ncbi:hypothetical protein NDU88_010323 [Pleurodeles waltl]|uniref:Uncharacterized protein n=1 Tax=Pleurodeles waltl TaxID=8319 RepID=A0AAV7QU31_PLEWA|nr:hypothetical protein NDU88_010323 [Pleurodeles waltl]